MRKSYRVNNEIWFFTNFKKPGKRWDLIRNDLEMLQSDICCLQEVQAEHFTVYIEPFLKSKNYEIIYG